MGGPGGAMPDTLWTEVLRAGSDSTGARAALERLIARYWKAVYVFVRRRGRGVEDSKDLTQAFFVDLLERHSVARADPERGRFRSWLLACLRNFLSDQADRSRAAKRGGGLPGMSLDGAESEYLREFPSDGPTPEEAFHRKWATELLKEALASLSAKWRSILEDPAADPRRAHEARAALREAILGRIRETVGSAREAEEEMRDLMRGF